MRVYVIRHGESETNSQKKWTGWMDVHLTDKGREDAKKTGELLKNVYFDEIYSSDLIRACETKEIALPGVEYEKTDIIREVNVGTLEGTFYTDTPYEKRVRFVDEGYAEYGGESKEEFVSRIKSFLERLEKNKCENIAVFCHGGVLCTMLDIVMEMRVPRSHYMCNNCTVAIFEFANDVWKLHSWINPV